MLEHHYALTRAGAPAPALIAVAHGSRDPRSAATVAALVEEVRRQRPDLDVRLSFLDLSAPRLADVLAAARADGHRRAVVVPLLLGRAFHADVDVPEAVHRGRRPGLDVDVADVLGGDRRLEVAALRRLAGALGAEPTGGVAPHQVDPDPRRPTPRLALPNTPTRAVEHPDSRCRTPRLADRGLGVVLAGAGSSSAAANAVVSGVVEGWTRRFGWHGGRAAFAAASGPTVPEAIAELRRLGARRVAVASWFLAPGQLPDRVERAALESGAALAAPLGAHPAVAALVLDRYAAAAHAGSSRARSAAVRAAG